jgi:hypothetical protein
MYLYMYISVYIYINVCVYVCAGVNRETIKGTRMQAKTENRSFFYIPIDQFNYRRSQCQQAWQTMLIVLGQYWDNMETD